MSVSKYFFINFDTQITELASFIIPRSLHVYKNYNDLDVTIINEGYLFVLYYILIHFILADCYSLRRVFSSMSWGGGSWLSSGTRDPNQLQLFLRIQLLPCPPALLRLSANNQPHQRRMEKIQKMAVRMLAKMRLGHRLQMVRLKERV